MTDRLERHYRRLLLAYPRGYREANGGELTATLLEASPPGRRTPPAREAFALVRGGLAERARAATAGPRPWWVDGLHLALPPLILANTVAAFWTIYNHAWFGAVMALLMLPVVFGRARLALPVALFAALQVSGPTSDLGVGHGVPVSGWSVPLGFWAVAAILAVLAVRGDRLRRRSPLWLAATAAVLGYAHVSAVTGPPWTLLRAVVEVALLGLAVAATAVTRDGRWALASSLYLVGAIAPLAEYPFVPGWRSISYWGTLAALTLATVILPRRRARTL
ncbi:hypothetical protein [Actinomadura macrotermitis]|uniref:Uncharacterized protein n=1 Tax=Actinomadura macrotermitis TaxID=2585200 RepID=A0A7K0BVZ8_9ACTN|nr:hypothetical protein [Actinomadura macrotermitis]MQY05353.1 hypothetical protein [Actinomadura macrotermitis]